MIVHNGAMVGSETPFQITMSANEPQQIDVSAESDEATDAVEDVAIEAQDEPIEYEETTSQSRRDHRTLTNDWVAGVYPSNTRSDRAAGTIYYGQKEGVQHDDGTGELRYRRQTCAIRTVSGLVIKNSDFGGIDINHRASRLRGACEEHDVELAHVGLDFVRGIINHQTTGRVRRGHDLHATQIVDVERDGDNNRLITFENNTQVFYGYDHTSHGSGRFGFVIEARAPVPEPERALDLLTPDEVLRAQADGAEIERQGEWFFVDEQYSDDEPQSAIHKPGVNSKPFGPTPLDSHIPRDWKAQYDDETVVENYLDHDGTSFVTEQPDLDDAGDVVKHYAYGELHYKSDLTWAQLQDEILGGVWLRGTVRHDRNEHYIENLGDTWHKAVTHRKDVITQDDVGNVRMD